MTTDVGVLIPTTVMNRIIESLTDAGNILPLVTRTSYRGGLSIPISTVRPVATWVAEGEGSEKQKKTVGYIEFKYYKLRCAVAMTLEVDTMSLSVFEATLIANIIEAMTIALEKAIINGSGTGQPKGILTENVSPDKVISLAGTGVSFSDLAKAEAALPAEYDNKAEWFMNKRTWIQCETITGDDGHPIFRNTIDKDGKFVRTILGRKVNVTSYMTALTDSTSAGTTIAFLYDPKDYILNINKQFTMKKYEDNETDDQILKAIALADGKSVKNDSLVKVIASAT
jgi:HK97 family phage major capsid protein